MDLKERLWQILKSKYEIETNEELMEALENMPGIDLGIFVNRPEGEVKSA